MKVHVFIATTKGLVAVQKITDLDDEELQSFFSVRGTTQVLPISTAYHNLVRKGTGIIQQNFGGTSYRADVSDEINQGNSWQLGIYIAHAVHHLGLLGNGQLQANDKMIIASGEINTSDKTVHRVGEIPLKYQLAEAYCAQHGISPEQCEWVLAEENQADVPEQYPITTRYIQYLNDTSSLLPAMAASAKKNTGNKNQKSKSGSIALTLLAAVTFAAFVFNATDFVAVWQPDKSSKPAVSEPAGNSPKKPELTHQIKPGEQSDTPAHADAVLELPQLVGVYREKTSNLDDFRPNTDCANTSLKRTLALTEKQFAATKLDKLCKLQLTTVKSVSAVYFVAFDSGFWGRATRSGSDETHATFTIPAPSMRNENRQYGLALFEQALSEEAQSNIKRCLSQLPDELLLSERTISNCLSESQLDWSFYTHTLLVKT
ncbi:hypothetical protein [Planctobacterium marinum]|uniref:Uncharacterized protein n=1 Tax=Planctobacterium marinum TaxID=1631968 RepID=A0AA48I5N5_9ALTE|nr:hypothetical protein MACH26_18960 [Planctobacterium marinum]